MKHVVKTFLFKKKQEMKKNIKVLDSKPKNENNFCFSERQRMFDGRGFRSSYFRFTTPSNKKWP